MSAYYNEIDPYAAQWLRNLIAAGHIAPGEVDERSIADVRADDLRGFCQCHFFAGIGVWSYALRLAGWPDDRPVWTGSCPCQPFSEAGSKLGFTDERHLWPAWAGLIAQRHPGVVFGEQVAAKNGLAWLDAVHADLEAMGYASGATVLPAAGFGAPHGRHRIFFVADSNGERFEGWTEQDFGEIESEQPAPRRRDAVRCGEPCAVDNTADARHDDPWQHGSGPSLLAARLVESGAPDVLEYAAGEQVGLPGRSWLAGATAGFWRDVDWLPCIDGKARPVEPGTFPLAHGAPARVGRLRAYGNAINAPQAQEFIRAYMSASA